MASHEFPPEQIFEYRLVRKTYCYRTQYDDGPGSFPHVVSDDYVSVIREWNGDAAFGEDLVKEGLAVNYRVNDDDGRSETSYRLERRASSDSPWKYVGHVRLYCWWDEEDYSN